MNNTLYRFLPKPVKRYLRSIDANIERLNARINDLEFRLQQMERTEKQLRSERYSEAFVRDEFSVQTIAINGIELHILDHTDAWTPAFVANEMLNDDYGIEALSFESDDLVIDIGANIGIFSIYLAKRYPFLRIFAYEPIPATYALLVKNLELNSITSVKTHRLAVTNDGRDIEMWPSWSFSNAAATMWVGQRLSRSERVQVASTTLDSIFADNSIEHCKLLKIDCEGSEHEILLNTKVLDRIEYLSLEAHDGERLEQEGYTNERLLKFLSARFPSERLHVKRAMLSV